VLELLSQTLPSRARLLLRCGRTAHRARCLRCGREIVVPTCNLRRTKHPTVDCGCRHLLPAAAPRSGAPLAASTVPVDPIVRTPTSAMVEAPLTAQERLDGWHVSQLGRTRRVCVPVAQDDDEAGGVLFDGDPWND
jgi:hypothetical protein